MMSSFLVNALLGTQVDEAKCFSHVVSIVVLGARVMIDLAKRTVLHRLCEVKAAKWARLLDAVLEGAIMPSGEASRWAGRCGGAATVTYCKAARAFLRPLHRQAHAPLAHGRIEWLASQFVAVVAAVSPSPVDLERPSCPPPPCHCMGRCSLKHQAAGMCGAL